MNNTFIVVAIVSIFFSYIIPNEVDAVVKFRRPITTTMSPMFSGWYDHNSTSGTSKNYACTANSPYDGHKGTDFSREMGEMGISPIKS